MQNTASTSPDHVQDTSLKAHAEVFDDFESYAFLEDPVFKSGLPTVIQSVRGAKRSAAEIDEMISRAQWFYFTRLRSIDLPWEAYAEHVSRGATACASSSTSASIAQATPTADARRMMISDDYTTPGNGAHNGLTFDLLAELISEGKEVPGIRDIPDELNTEPPSAAIMPRRPKPWEVQTFSTAEGTFVSGDPLLTKSPLPDSAQILPG